MYTVGNSQKSGDAEVLIVGASLAGLVAARETARRGVSTLLIDAAPEIGARDNPANLVMEPLWPGSRVDLPEEAVTRELSGVRVGGPSGEGPTFEFRAVHLDRGRADRILAERARGCGAQIQGGIRVERAFGTDARGLARLRTDAGEFTAPVIIFADGANSTVGNLLSTMRNPKDVSWGMDQLLEGPGIGCSRYFEVRFGSFAPGWRVQMNPLGENRAHLWTFIRGGSKEDLPSYSERTRELFVGFSEANVLEELVGADPAFVAPHRISADSILVCGAAAGQGGLENGAWAGLLAGEVAAAAVKTGDTSRRGLKEYEQQWRKKVMAEIVALRWIMGSFRYLSDPELDEFFESLSGLVLSSDEFRAILRGNPASLVRKADGRRVSRLLATIGRAWLRAAKSSAQDVRNPIWPGRGRLDR